MSELRALVMEKFLEFLTQIEIGNQPNYDTLYNAVLVVDNNIYDQELIEFLWAKLKYER